MKIKAIWKSVRRYINYLNVILNLPESTRSGIIFLRFTVFPTNEMVVLGKMVVLIQNVLNR